MNKIRNTSISEFNAELKLKGFKVYEFGSEGKGYSYSRKDFYKINIP